MGATPSPSQVKLYFNLEVACKPVVRLGSTVALCTVPRGGGKAPDQIQYPVHPTPCRVEDSWHTPPHLWLQP
jgi:hypothetical protein